LLTSARSAGSSARTTTSKDDSAWAIGKAQHSQAQMPATLHWGGITSDAARRHVQGNGEQGLMTHTAYHSDAAAGLQRIGALAGTRS